jgi:hypothetical protein
MDPLLEKRHSQNIAPDNDLKIENTNFQSNIYARNNQVGKH